MSFHSSLLKTKVFLTFQTIQGIEGWFTLWTMKLDHGRGPFSMVQVHGPTFMVRLLKKTVLKALGPSLGVNVDQDE